MALAVSAAMLASPAAATSTYDYKKNEYVVVDGGLAPNHKLSVAAHGEGEGGAENFHLHLMAEPAHRKLATLGIGPGNSFDSGPDSYIARWSPDSRYVALTWRVGRHELGLMIYAVGQRREKSIRARLVRGPGDVLLVVVKDKAAREAADDQRSRGIEVIWQSPTHFLLRERRVYKVQDDQLQNALAGYGRREPEPAKGESNAVLGAGAFVDFAVDAQCEVKGDQYRIVGVKPGAFEGD
jgi:hypothetical protein